jgi:ariadne-1
MQLIRQLQAEDEEEREARVREHGDKDEEAFICQICFEGFTEESVFPLSSCDHVFHEDCLAAFLRQALAEARLPLRCPEAGCPAVLAPEDLTELLTPAELDKCHHFSLNQAFEQQKDLSWCPTPNCEYAFVYNPEEDGED